MIVYGLDGSLSPGQPYMGAYPVSHQLRSVYIRTICYADLFTSLPPSPSVCDKDYLRHLMRRF